MPSQPSSTASSLRTFGVSCLSIIAVATSVAQAVLVTQATQPDFWDSGTSIAILAAVCNMLAVGKLAAMALEKPATPRQFTKKRGAIT